MQFSQLSFLVSVLAFSVSAQLNSTAPPYASASSFVVLASTFTNTLEGTVVSGDLGYTTGPAMFPGHPFGTLYTPSPVYFQAGLDQGVALAFINSRICNTSWAGAVDFSQDARHPGGVYYAGIYCIYGVGTVSTTMTLSGPGQFIFKILGALNTNYLSRILLTNGASACNVHWASTGTTFGASSVFVGTVIDDSAITVGARTIWNGRALSYGGTVTTGTQVTITAPQNCPGAPTSAPSKAPTTKAPTQKQATFKKP